MIKEEYKTIIHNGFEYAIPSFVDGRTSIFKILREDGRGNLIFIYLGHEMTAIKVGKVDEESLPSKKTNSAILKWIILSLVIIVVISIYFIKFWVRINLMEIILSYVSFISLTISMYISIWNLISSKTTIRRIKFFYFFLILGIVSILLDIYWQGKFF